MEWVKGVFGSSADATNIGSNTPLFAWARCRSSIHIRTLISRGTEPAFTPTLLPDLKPSLSVSCLINEYEYYDYEDDYYDDCYDDCVEW